MDVVEESDFVKARPLKKKKKAELSFEDNIGEAEFERLLEDMQNPIKAQQEIAAKIKVSLDRKIDQDIAERGYLSDHTRRWVEAYNKILESIQKGLYGDRSVNLHVHKVTHSQIAAKIREAL